MTDVLVSGVRAVAEFVGYLTALAAAAYAVYRRLRPSPPDVLVHGPGAALSHEVDPATGKKRWTIVEPSWSIENADDKNIYDVKTGLRTRDGEVELPHDGMQIPLIQARVRQNVRSLRLTKELLDHVAGTESPHLEFIYWARFRDASARWWEVRHEPPDPMPKVSRLRRWHWRKALRVR